MSEESLYKAAFYYAVGIISTFEWYEDIPPEEISSNILTRAAEILAQHGDDEQENI